MNTARIPQPSSEHLPCVEILWYLHRWHAKNRGDAKNHFRTQETDYMTTSISHRSNVEEHSTPSEGREVRIADLQASGFWDPGSEAGN